MPSRTRLLADTNYIIQRRSAALPAGFLLSAVVLQELAAGARDQGRLRELAQLRLEYERDGKLVVPNGEDWWFASAVLNALLRGVRSNRRGHTPAISKEEQQRLLRDALIARSAKRVNATVVTYNTRDFAKIRRFCNLAVAEPDEIL
jgi:predicted nucleic acid-binding protein